LARDGAILRLAEGVVVDNPIELVFYSDPGGSPVVSNPRSMVVAARDSSATLIETHVGSPDGRYWTNAVTEVVLEPGSAVEHYKIQDEAESAFHLALLDVRQRATSRFRSHAVMLGSSIARHEVRVALEGEGSDVDLDGLYLPSGEQHHDNPILVDHLAPGCTSRQLYKGIVGEGGHGVFNGHIIVRPAANRTEASQTNKNLLLSDRAEVDTRPRLEIRADDVQCTHGATVGRLDLDALFYLRSRGIAEQAARGVLTHAFAREMVTRCPPGPIRARIEELVAGRLLHGGGQA
ncbi:MAG: Fe-S cluster assembly protein SufD, partial [Acidimicrobiales bacterium]